MKQFLLKSEIRTENDIVWARRKARDLALFLKLENQEQIRLATAVSELARNAFQYAGGGIIEFYALTEESKMWVLISVVDRGAGIKNLTEILNGSYVSPHGMGVGLMGSKKLVDEMSITSTTAGTSIVLKKLVPHRMHQLNQQELSALAGKLMMKASTDPIEEIQKQNHEILLTISALNEKKEELSRLNQELEDTNRGVVALYAELDEKAESLRIANETKTSFLSDMTHEFRSPLNSIMSLSNILLEDARDEGANEREKQIQFIIKAANGLSNLVNDLLDIAKIEAGKVNVRVEDFSVHDLFSTLRGLMRPLEGDLHHVQLQFLEVDEALKLTTDEGKVAQILRNLISNAIKYTEKGSVMVTASRINLDKVQFSVKDTGIGIAPEHLAEIFGEFFQVDHALQKKNRGTGLGLALTKKLITLLQGDIVVESEVGIGSTFKVTLPLTYEGPSEAQYKVMTPEIIPATMTFKNPNPVKKILVIDDEEDKRYQMSRALQDFQIEYREAVNGLDALQIMEQYRPDLLILDLVMPQMDGMEFLKKSMERPGFKDLKIILYTSKDLEPEEREYLEQITLCIIPKDARSSVLVAEAVRKYL